MNDAPFGFQDFTRAAGVVERATCDGIDRYEGQMICRSLDAIQSSHDPRTRCAGCPQCDRCTVYVRVELILGGRPYRLLLAKVSARNFLVYIGIRSAAPGVRIRVVSRGSWGEARFEDMKADSP